MNENFYIKTGGGKFITLPNLTKIHKLCLENDYQYDEVIKQINQTKCDFEMFLNDYDLFKNCKKIKNSSKAKKIIKRSIKK